LCKRILIIDDDAMIRDVTQACLEFLDWQVYTASSGKDGLVAAASHELDAILLDVMMPGMDGPDTLAALRESPATRDLPVVFLTAKAQVAERDRLAKLGVKGVLQKPFDPLLLAEQVAGLMGWNNADPAGASQ
jgi:CheY-like chemotaxis protein